MPDESTAAATDVCEGMSVEGPVVTTEWGPIQVEAVVDNGVVCSAEAVSYPDADRKSIQINQYVLSVINAEVAAKGNASFNTASSATVTSEG